MIRTWVWSRILCRWELKFLTPAAWGQLPHVVAGSLALVCVGIPPAWTPPPPIPPVTFIPPGPPGIVYPPPWSPVGGGYVPPSAWIPPAGFVPFENGGGDVAGGVAPIRGRLDDVGPSGGPVVEHQSPVVTPPPPDQRVPEPGSLALAMFGLLAIVKWRRR